MISFTNSFANRAGEARPGADLGPFRVAGAFSERADQPDS